MKRNVMKPLILITLLATLSPAALATFTIPTIEVIGSATLSAKADYATLHFDVETVDKSATVSQEKNAKVMNQIIAEVKKSYQLNPEDLQTNAFQLNPEYDYRQRKKIFNGFKVRNSMSLTVRDLPKLGKVIDSLIKSGATNISQVQFQTTKYKELKDKAYLSALGNARKLADKLAKKADRQIRRVRHVMVIDSGHRPMPMAKTMSFESAPSGTPIESGSLQISAKVKVHFEHK